MFCISTGSNSVQGPSKAEKGFYHGFILEPFLLLVPLMRDITFLEHNLKVLMFFVFFCPSLCPVFFTQSLRSMPSQPLSERRRLHVDPPRSRVQVLLSEEIQRDALRARYAPTFPVVLSKQLNYFPLCDQTSFRCSFQTVLNSPAAAADGLLCSRCRGD